jgi:endonuclease/exonuclease/phosphatase family metal-dependent hydrolase
MKMNVLLLLLALPLAGQQQVRVVTYNIHHAEGTDGKIDAERIARVIRSADPDFAAVQEVDVRTARVEKADLVHDLARLTGLHAVFGRTIDHQGGWYGNAVLSRWPLNGFVNHEMPFTPGREKRGVLEALSNAGFRFLATHLDTSEGDRLPAVRRIHELVAERGDLPMILAGDLNATLGSATMNALLEDWSTASLGEPLPTIPSAKPARQIDYVLFRPAARWRVVEVRVLDEPVASDHRPVLAVLELLADAGPAPARSVPKQ